MLLLSEQRISVMVLKVRMSSKAKSPSKSKAKSPSKSKKTSNEGWTCVSGANGNTAYMHNGEYKPVNEVPSKILKALREKSLTCSIQTMIRAGPGAKLPGQQKKVSPKEAASQYKCVKEDGQNIYRQPGLGEVRESMIPREVRDLITCKEAANAYYNPESTGKTRSQTLYFCKGAWYKSDKKHVPEDQIPVETKKGRKCTPEK